MQWLNSIPILSIVAYIPLVGALLLIFLFPKEKTGAIKYFATFVAGLDFVASLPLWFAFERGQPGYQFVERASWIPSLGVEYHFGIDGISLVLVLLTTFIGFIAVYSSFTAITERQKEYYVLLLLLQTFMIGTFCCLDFFLFYVFWEIMLVPMYFLIGVWGGERRLYAAIKFFLYTLAGSVLMLLGIIALYFYNTTGFLGYKGLGNPTTFSIEKLTAVAAGMPVELQIWLFFAFFLGFAIKVPMFPFHTWLPDAHTEAPTAGSVILAAVLLKMGTYGFVRFSLPMFPKAIQTPWVLTVMVTLAIIGIVYGAMVTLVQKDMKKLIAYSSVSHLGFVMLGVFALNMAGIQGGILQMVNHGISTGALFLLVGIIYERRHTRMIADYGGLARQMPLYATYFLIMALSSMGLPLLNGFIGEFVILQGAFARNFWWAFSAAIGIVLGAAYLLWLYQRVFFGELTNPANQNLPDLSVREQLTLAPLVLVAFWIGLYPRPLFDVLRVPSEQIVRALGGQTQTPPAMAEGSAQAAPLSAVQAEAGGRALKVEASDWFLVAPELFLTAAGLLLLILAVFFTKAKEEFLGFLSVLSVVGTAVVLSIVAAAAPRAKGPIFAGMFVLDNFALFFKYVILLSIGLTVLASIKYVGQAPYPGGEYYALLLFTGVGMLFMVSGSNLISIYVALELMALSSYVLAGYFKGEIRSTEAALKYFVLGAFSSGVLLYGLSLVYGVSGKMGLTDLAQTTVSGDGRNLFVLGILLLLVGLLFKIAAVPFHVWTPDVYEGSPTPITAFFSVGPKVAAYAILARIFYVGFPKFHADWGLIVAIVSAATLVWGNLAALLQTNVKRMLAYSSIAHAGYALLGVLGFRTAYGLWGVLVYLLAYTFMNFGAFALVIFLETRGYAAESVADFNGLAKRNMPAALTMLLFLLSLAGIPPTAGFIGKYYLFTAAMKAGYAWLAVLAVLASAVSLFYYFRIAAAMFFSDAAGAKLRTSYALAAAVVICAAGTLLIGVAPEGVLAVLRNCVPGGY